MSAAGMAVAVPAAVGAAAAFGTAGVLQHRATHETAPTRPLSPRLLVELVRLRAFRSGVLLGVLGFALQVTALRFGPLILVQPLLITGVLFYLLLASYLHHRAPDKTLIGGALMALAGLSAFLAVAQPSGGGARFSAASALPLGIGLISLVALCLLLTAHVPGELRSLPLAAATAVCYGVTAGLVRSLTTGPTSWSGILHEWELYAVVVVGPAGFLLNQNAYQSGTVGSLALATITVGDPLVAIGVGTAWLGESITLGPGVLVGEMAALAVMVAGVFLLANRAQRLADRMRAAGTIPEGYGYG